MDMLRVVMLGIGMVLGVESVARADLEADLQALLQVDKDAVGHEAAQLALPRITRVDAGMLPQVLAAMDHAGPLSTNWLRAAVDTIVERALRQGEPLPIESLHEFLENRRHGARSRRLAFEVIVLVNPDERDGLLEKMLDDTSLELRYDAVARILERAEQSESDEKKPLYKQALKASRDIEQIEKCAAELEEQGEKVDLVRHLGFVTRWHVVGPFDNTDRAGLERAYPPEQSVDLAAEYKGKEGGAVSWSRHETDDERGMVDLNKAMGKNMGAAAYAYAEVEVEFDDSYNAQLRLGCINGHKVWLNGQLVDTNDVYHTGTKIDQYVTDVMLKPGRNVLLLKVCQNEQTDSWAQDWQFQLRITDPLGGAIPYRVVEPAP